MSTQHVHRLCQRPHLSKKKWWIDEADIQRRGERRGEEEEEEEEQEDEEEEEMRLMRLAAHPHVTEATTRRDFLSFQAQQIYEKNCDTYVVF